MRLWHKSLIHCLPDDQLRGQWRELSAIAGNINLKDSPNHILVNKIMKYPFNHFISYAFYIRQEMKKRGFRTMDSVWDKIVSIADDYNILPLDELFSEWHNDRYLRQCYYNLEEKYDCGGVSPEDMSEIVLECKDVIYRRKSSTGKSATAL